MHPLVEPIPIQLRHTAADLSLDEQEAEIILSALLLFPEAPDSLMSRVADILRAFGSGEVEIATVA